MHTSIILCISYEMMICIFGDTEEVGDCLSATTQYYINYIFLSIFLTNINVSLGPNEAVMVKCSVLSMTCYSTATPIL